MEWFSLISNYLLIVELMVHRIFGVFSTWFSGCGFPCFLEIIASLNTSYRLSIFVSWISLTELELKKKKNLITANSAVWSLKLVLVVRPYV